MANYGAPKSLQKDPGLCQHPVTPKRALHSCVGDQRSKKTETDPPTHTALTLSLWLPAWLSLSILLLSFCSTSLHLSLDWLSNANPQNTKSAKIGQQGLSPVGSDMEAPALFHPAHWWSLPGGGEEEKLTDSMPFLNRMSLISAVPSWFPSQLLSQTSLNHCRGQHGCLN